jgi:energy-coupling factor transport system ATP-binding protein
LVAGWADRVVVMGDGDVLADARPATVFDDPELLAAASLRQPQVVELSSRLGVTPPALTADTLVERLSATTTADTTPEER